MKCACGDKYCKSRLEWDIGGHTFRAVWEHCNPNNPEQPSREVMLYYDANALVELIKEAREALISLSEEDSQCGK